MSSLSPDTISLKCGAVDSFKLISDSSVGALRPFLFHLVGQLHSTRIRLKGIKFVRISFVVKYIIYHKMQFFFLLQKRGSRVGP